MPAQSAVPRAMITYRLCSTKTDWVAPRDVRRHYVGSYAPGELQGTRSTVATKGISAKTLPLETMENVNSRDVGRCRRGAAAAIGTDIYFG
jgi:hypothetical protein